MEEKNINNSTESYYLLNNLLNNYNSVLLVDDSSIDNFICKKVLEIFGCKNITICKDDNNAINFLKTLSKIPDLIIVNIEMGNNSGIKFLDKLKGIGISDKNSKIIAMVSSGLNKIYSLAEKRKLKIIEKPVTYNKIVEIFITTHQKN